jgi:TolB protein
MLLSLIFGSCAFLTACAPRILGTPTPGIIFASDRDGNWEIYRMNPDGTQLIRLTDHPQIDTDPDWSPDGSQIAFRSRRDGSSDIFIMNPDGSGVQNIVQDPIDSFDDEFAPDWRPGAEELVIYTDRFQPPLGNCRGGRGVHHLAFLPLNGGGQAIQEFQALAGEQGPAKWSPDGSQLALASACSADKFQLYLWDQQSGALREILPEEYNPSTPAWSPNGRQLAFVSNHLGNSDIYILELNSGETTNLTQHPATDLNPVWAPDGSRLAFVTDRDGNQEIYLLNLTTLSVTNLTRNPADDNVPDWSPVE